MCAGSVHQRETQPPWRGTTPRCAMGTRHRGAPLGPCRPSPPLSQLLPRCRLTTRQLPARGFQPGARSPALQSPHDPGKLCPPGAAAPSSARSCGAPGPRTAGGIPRHPLPEDAAGPFRAEGRPEGLRGHKHAPCAGNHGSGRGHGGTHHFEVFGGALLAAEEAGQQHLPDVVASPVVKLQHVERFGLEVSEVRLVLQDFQLLLVGGLGVGDLVS